MTVVFNNSGVSVQCNKRVSMSNVEQMPDPYMQQLDTAAGVIERYGNAHKEKIHLGSVQGAEDLISVQVAPDKGKPLIIGSGLVKCEETADKPFLRKVYERIQYITEGTKPRIETMKAETLEKLRKIGKIK